MENDVKELADRIGAKIIGQVPDTGGGAFGAARLLASRDTFVYRIKPVIQTGDEPYQPEKA